MIKGLLLQRGAGEDWRSEGIALGLSKTLPEDYALCSTARLVAMREEILAWTVPRATESREKLRSLTLDHRGENGQCLTSSTVAIHSLCGGYRPRSFGRNVAAHGCKAREGDASLQRHYSMLHPVNSRRTLDGLSRPCPWAGGLCSRASSMGRCNEKMRVAATASLVGLRIWHLIDEVWFCWPGE